MSFSSKNITQTTKRGISFLKGATFFFLGMSLVLFVTKAFEVVPTTQNFVSYFQKMFLTPDGFNTPSSETVILDGVAGDAFFAGTVTGTTVNATTVNATTVCLSTDPGTPCRTTWPTGGVSSANAAGNTTNIQFNGDGTNFSGSDDLVRDSTNGRLGIGTTTPRGQLDIVGSSNDTFLFTSNWLGAPGAMVLINSNTITNTGLLIGQNGPDVAMNNFDGQLSIGTKGNIGLNINASGNVGVNRELSVSYTGTFSQNLFIDGGNLLFGQGEKYIHLPIRTAGIGGNSPGHHLSIKAGDSSDNSAALTSGGNLYLQGGDVSSPGGGFYVAGNEQGGNVYIDGGGGAGIHGNVLLAYSGGNVGIGTNDPQYTLDVNGTGSFSGVCLSGYCRSTWPVGGGDSVWSTGPNQVVFYNGGKVGIGTGNPQAKLHISNGDLIIQTIRGSLLNSSLLRSSNETGYNAIVGGYIDNSLGVGWGIGVSKDRTSGTGSLGLGTTNHSPITIFSSGLQRMTVASNGYIGIGTDDPTEQLQIGDYAWIGQNIGGDGTGGSFLRIYGYDSNTPTEINIPIDAGGMSFFSNKAFAQSSTSDYQPNIQLDYHYKDVDGGDVYDNWRIVNGGSSLSLRHSNGTSAYTKYFDVSKNGTLSVYNSTGNLTFNSLGRMGIGAISTLLERLNVNGNVYFATGASLRAGSGSDNYQLYLAKNGNVGIHENNPSYELDVNGDVQAGAYYYSSDKRFKTDITSIINPLEKILSLNGYMFTWKATGERDMGVIAQEVEKIFPEIVSTNNEGYKSVEYGNLVAPLIEAIKELNAKVDQQNQEIQSLKQLIQ